MVVPGLPVQGRGCSWSRSTRHGLFLVSRYKVRVVPGLTVQSKELFLVSQYKVRFVPVLTVQGKGCSWSHGTR